MCAYHKKGFSSYDSNFGYKLRFLPLRALKVQDLDCWSTEEVPDYLIRHQCRICKARVLNYGLLVY